MPVGNAGYSHLLRRRRPNLGHRIARASTGLADPNPGGGGGGEAPGPGYSFATHMVSDSCNSTTPLNVSGLAVDDLFIGFAVYRDAGVTAQLPKDTYSYTWTLYGYSFDVVFRWLEAADLVTPTRQQITVGSGGGGGYAVYRGVSSVIIQSGNMAGGATDDHLLLPGFSKSANHAGLVSFIADRDGSGSPTAPAGFTLRDSVSYGYFMTALADALTDADISVGADWTTLGTIFGAAGVLIELLS